LRFLALITDRSNTDTMMTKFSNIKQRALIEIIVVEVSELVQAKWLKMRARK